MGLTPATQPFTIYHLQVKTNKQYNKQHDALNKLGSALARHTGQEESEKIRHLSQGLAGCLPGQPEYNIFTFISETRIVYLVTKLRKFFCYCSSHVL